MPPPFFIFKRCAVYIVFFWNHDPAIGEFLDRCRFDTMQEARRFRKSLGARFSSIERRPAM